MTSRAQPAVTVAVATHERARLLPRLIESLEGQTLSRDRFEVVIVDDGSQDATHDTLQRLAETSQLNLRVFRNNQNRGAAQTRNVAWRAANAPIIAFTDDDCMPTPEWLEAGLVAMDGRADIVVGRTAPAPDQQHLLGPFSRTMITTDERYYATCNIFYRRADLEAVGGFDDGFGTTAGEDTDLAYRVRRLARTVSFVPEALVYHDVRPSSVRAAVRDVPRWAGIVRLVRRNPEEARAEHLWRPYFWKDSHPRAILATLGLVVGVVFPPALALTLPYVWWRLRVSPRTWSRTGRFLVLPGTFAVDLFEILVLLRASLRYRTLVL